jgi:hypothetical protein
MSKWSKSIKWIIYKRNIKTRSLYKDSHCDLLASGCHSLSLRSLRIVSLKCAFSEETLKTQLKRSHLKNQTRDCLYFGCVNTFLLILSFVLIGVICALFIDKNVVFSLFQINVSSLHFSLLLYFLIPCIRFLLHGKWCCFEKWYSHGKRKRNIDVINTQSLFWPEHRLLPTACPVFAHSRAMASVPSICCLLTQNQYYKSKWDCH